MGSPSEFAPGSAAELAPEFGYQNRTGRRSGPVLRVAARILPGVGQVQSQVVPYAQQWQAANRAALVRPGPRWIVLGDSMSQGIGASRFDAGWVNQVHEQLKPTVDYAIVNLAASGAVVRDVISTQLSAWRSLPAPRQAGTRPDLVTVLIGSNDLISRRHSQDLPAAFAELLEALPPGAVVATLPQPRQPARAVNALIEDAGARRGIVAAEMGAGVRHSWRGRLAADHFHPNDLGYAGIAEVFLAAVRSCAPSDIPI